MDFLHICTYCWTETFMLHVSQCMHVYDLAIKDSVVVVMFKVREEVKLPVTVCIIFSFQ